MRIALTDPRDAPGLESLLFTYEWTAARPNHALHRVLSPAQRHAIARFLAHLAMDPDRRDGLVLRALRAGWAHDLDPEHRACVAP